MKIHEDRPVFYKAECIAPHLELLVSWSGYAILCFELIQGCTKLYKVVQSCAKLCKAEHTYNVHMHAQYLELLVSWSEMLHLAVRLNMLPSGSQEALLYF